MHHTFYFTSIPVSKCYRLTRDYSECNGEPDWKPCSDTTPQRKPWVSADRSTNIERKWWFNILHTARNYAWPLLTSVVYDSQWSTGWSLGSSLTSHPPLSTLPAHLQHIEKTNMRITHNVWLKTWHCCSSALFTLDGLSSRHLLQVHRHVGCTQWNRGGNVHKRQWTSGQVIC